MTGLAVWTQAALVEILMAGDAGSGQTKVGAVQVLFLDGRAFLRRNVRSIVALVAVYSGVLALKQISGFFVVKGLDIPLDKGEILAIVIGVAAGAPLARMRGNVVGGMKAPVGRYSAADFSMAFHAFKGSLAAKLVTAHAVRGPTQRLMGPR